MKCSLVARNNALLTFCRHIYYQDRRGRDHMLVGFTTTYAISTYHH
jgi:hypothetical protein